MNTPVDEMASRRTVEALRAGVPNRDAVSQLGCTHPQIEQKFFELLGATEFAISAGTQPKGILVSGDFGSGKSHLLQYLEHRALEENFLCSKIVVSKETPLSDPVRVFRAAVAEMRVPGRLGVGLNNVAMAVKFNKHGYSSFYEWADSGAAALASQLPATLYLFEYGHDEELRRDIVRFWAGEQLLNTRIKAKLKEAGQLSNYSLGRLPNRVEMARQRFRFVAQLARAAGYKGWVVLIDEVELIGQYTLRQRARAYRELAQLLGFASESPDTITPGLATVAAITSDFEAKVLASGRNDLEDIPNKLRSTGREEDAALVVLAERGMRVIRRERESLTRLTAEVVARTHDDLRRIYSDAFQWDAPDVLDRNQHLLSSAVMRPLVRRWITQWDIARLYPGAVPQIEEDDLQPFSYEEDTDLDEQPSDG